MENVFRIKEKLNGTDKMLYEVLILSFLENSIFNLFLRIIEQEKKDKSGLVYFEENSDESVTENMDHVMKKIEYEITLKKTTNFTKIDIYLSVFVVCR